MAGGRKGGGQGGQGGHGGKKRGGKKRGDQPPPEAASYPTHYSDDYDLEGMDLMGSDADAVPKAAVVNMDQKAQGDPQDEFGAKDYRLRKE